MNKARWFVTMMVVLGLAVGVVLAQEGGALETQLNTAIAHAGFSSEADALEMAQRHLGHVLNCIEGEGGEHFDAAWGHPCGGQGEGIVNDLAEHPMAADVALLVEAARNLAVAGVQADSLAAVQNAARGVRVLLELLMPPG
jgi:hypothetical protein